MVLRSPETREKIPKRFSLEGSLGRKSRSESREIRAFHRDASELGLPMFARHLPYQSFGFSLECPYIPLRSAAQFIDTKVTTVPTKTVCHPACNSQRNQAKQTMSQGGARVLGSVVCVETKKAAPVHPGIFWRTECLLRYAFSGRWRSL